MCISRVRASCAMTSPTEPGSTGAPPNSRRAQVTGLGLVGTSIALALRAQGWHVTGRDLDEDRSRRARELGAVDELGMDHLAAVAFVATPVAAIAAEVNALLAVRRDRRARRHRCRRCEGADRL